MSVCTLYPALSRFVTCVYIATSVVHSKLDYCNSLSTINSLSLNYPVSSRSRTLLLVLSSPKSCHITSILRWLRITERIEYKLLSLTYKVLTTTQPPYLHNLISVQCPRSTRSSSVVTLARMIASFIMLHLVSGINSLYLSSSISDSPIPSPITSSSSVSPLCTSITPSLFHSRLKTYPCSFTSSFWTAFKDYCPDQFF